MATDPYVYPGTSALRNLYGIRDPQALAELEEKLTSPRALVIDALGIPGTFDLEHLQAFHRALFGDLYEWAGELRTVDISKGQSFGHHSQIAAYLGERLQYVRAEDYLRGLRRREVVDRLAHYLGEINAVHPFLEGNGRAQRAYIRQLARRAGWELNWNHLDPSENIAVSIASLNGNDEPLRRLLDARIAALSPDASNRLLNQLDVARPELFAAQELVELASPQSLEQAGDPGDIEPRRASTPDLGAERDR